MEILTTGKHSSSTRNNWWQLGIFIVILNTMIGCDLFSSTKSSQPDTQSIAPTANFELSEATGKAPLTVSFTDLSSNGTSPIHSWQWDFGDGNSSDQQNPQHIYQTAGIYDVQLIVSSNNGSDSMTRGGSVTVDAPDLLVTVSLVNHKGIAIPEVTATSESFELLSQSYNEFSQLALVLRPTDTAGVIRLSKTGYTDALLYLENIIASQTVSLTMAKRNPAIQFDGFTGAELIGVDGASADIPADAFVRPDGSIANGIIDAYITPIDISDSIMVNAFPGSFYGLPNLEDIPDGEDRQQQLFSYGVVEYTFFEDGVELQLRDGVEANLELPIYVNENIFEEELIEGGLIPMWTLNESSGIWEQQGEGIIVANPSSPSGFSLSATTSHFSWFNTDAWAGSNNGSGNGPRNPVNCFVTFNITGLSIDETFKFSLSNLAIAGPVSTLSNYMIYDGTAIATRVPAGSLISATIERGNNKASKAVLCISSQITVDINLEEIEPEFDQWNLTAEPVFSREDENSLYEISANKVLIGGTFYGTDRVEIESSLVGAQLLTLPSGMFFEADFSLSDNTPTIITATLKNDIGEVQRVSPVDFVEEQSPTLDYLYIETTPDGFSQKYTWKVEGADDATVYYLEEDPASIGLLVLNIDDMESGTLLDSQLLNLPGYIRVEFGNQYGNTTVISRLSELRCIEGSELCGPATQ
jgi:PKD repeat protein